MAKKILKPQFNNKLPYILVFIIVVFILVKFTQGYNLPGENIMIPAMTLAVLAFQSYRLGMKYAMNVLLGIFVMFMLYAPQYAESGSYDPRAFISLFVNVSLATISVNAWAYLISWLF
jgi:hypothetical protein